MWKFHWEQMGRSPEYSSYPDVWAYHLFSYCWKRKFPFTEVWCPEPLPCALVKSLLTCLFCINNTLWSRITSEIETQTLNSHMPCCIALLKCLTCVTTPELKFFSTAFTTNKKTGQQNRTQTETAENKQCSGHVWPEIQRHIINWK